MDLSRERTDHALAVRVAAGDEHAFASLTDRHRRRLVAFAAGRLGERRDEAEDVVQDALLRAFRSMRGGKVPEHVSAWLHTIVANCCADRHQAAGRRPTVPLADEEDVAGHAEDPHAAFVRREQVRDAVDAISALPEAQRNAVVGYELEGRSYEELGARHGWSLAATKSLLWRARAGLDGTRASWAGVGGPPAILLALRGAVTGAGDRVAAIASGLPLGGEAAACLLAAAAIGSAPALEQAARTAVPDRPAAAVAASSGTSAAPASAGADPTTGAPADRGAGDGDATPAVSADDVLRRCADGGSLDGLPAGALERARRAMPTDLEEYTSCSSEIDAALLSRGG